MTTSDVAIIGAAGIFPDAPDLETFHRNLSASRDSVGAPGEARVRAGGDEPGERYLSMGYLDRIDLFDHELFGIPLREAELMDPHQRLLLQLTYQAMESAGYAPGRLRGSPAAVLLAAIDPGFDPADADRDLVKMLGTSTAALAARLSYQFDLQGPSLVVDTACSSGLTALSIAVGQLRRREVPLAVVGGVNLFPVLINRAGWAPLPGLESSDERCRPFDAEANGLTAGEGGGVLLLKLLSDAVAAGDNVLAVVKGIAVNHNGYRASSLAAPSQVGQAGVMTAAWRDGGVGADTIGYIECHGSGTPLGDVVEVDALRRAFAEAGGAARPCAISSVKANIGHLGNSAGIAGLFKVMSALRHGTHYPAVNFNAPNPLIDFSGPVYVNTEAVPWPQPAASVRRAGLSSWGLTGTNVHAVLEQAPAPAAPQGDGPPDEAPVAELVTVSARSVAALDRYRLRLAEFAERTEHDLSAVAHVLNRGRDDHPYRMSVTAATTAELAGRLRAAAPAQRPGTGSARPVGSPQPVLLFPGDAVVPDARWARLCAELAVPAECAELDAAATAGAARLVVRQYAVFRVVEALGLTEASLIGSGPGNLAVQVARGARTLADAVAESGGREPTAELDEARLQPLVAGLARDGAVVLELGGGGVLGRRIRALAPELRVVDLVGDGTRAGVLAALGEAYTLGAPLSWDRHYRDAAIPRIEAPTYPFEATPCRLTTRRVPPNGAGPVGPGPAGPVAAGRPDVETTQRRVAEIWSELLDVQQVGPDSHYFQLGGTSLVGVGLLRRLQLEFGVEVTFTDLYAHPTVGELSTRLCALAGERTGTGAPAPIARVARGGPLPLSLGQEPLWYLDQINPASPLYNVPLPLHLAGPLDPAALQDALVDVAARHEVLSSSFLADENGSPYVALTAPEPLMPVVDLSRLPEQRRRQRVRALIRESVSLPFDLSRDAPLRAWLIRLADDDHVLVLTFHHIVFDGGSGAVFLGDLAEYYRARSTGTRPQLPELPVQYQDYAVWHRGILTGERLAAGLEFWRRQLAGLNRPELPVDRPRPDIQSYAGAVLPVVVDAEVAQQVREFSRGAGVTSFVTMLAALDALIHLWSGHTDVIIGVATSGRIHQDVQNLVGYFNNLPPFRTAISGDLRFADLVRRCAETVAGVLDHEEVPVGKIISAAELPRDLARHPLYDVTYTYQNVPPYQEGLTGLRAGRYADTEVSGVVPGTAKFDLSFGVADTGAGAMLGELEYATALFDQATGQRLALWFPALVAAAMADPDRRLRDLAYSGEEPALRQAAARAGETEPVWTASSGPVGATPRRTGPGGATPVPPPPTAPPEPDPGTAPAAAPSGPPSPVAAPATAPDGGALQILQRLYGELIGVAAVRPDDDFFALGGDSVMSIQLVARARRAGLTLTQRQVFEQRTPAALATLAAAGPAAAAPGADPDGAARIPLTPVMRELAERAGLPGRTTLSVLLAVPAGMDESTLAGATRAVLSHHEMLRGRLVCPDGDPASWYLAIAPAGSDGPNAEIRRVDAAGLARQALTELSVREGRAASGRIDPRTGAMVQLVWLDRGEAEEGRLLVVAHHLVVDVLSWQVIVADLTAAYTALAQGRPAALQQVPTTFGQWARTLAAQARDASATAELPVWQRALAPGEPLIGGRPVDPRRDTAEHGQHVSVPVPPQVTAGLLADVPAAFRAATGDIVLAALAAAVAEWRAARGMDPARVLVDVEGNGREPLADDMDLSRTVGWFTCAYPVRLDPGSPDFADARAGGSAAGLIAARIQDQLRLIPGNGLGYGKLRYLNPDTATALAGLPTPSIGFNYLGGLTGMGPGPATGGRTAAVAGAGAGAASWRQVDTAGDVAEATPFGHALEAVGIVLNGPDGPVLRLSLWCSRHLLAESEIRELCEGWAALLTGMARHVAGAGPGGKVRRAALDAAVGR